MAGDMTPNAAASPSVEIRPEGPADIGAIRVLTSAAFENAPHSAGTEAAIVDALRAGGALTLSLVAVQDADVIGHVAFSPVTIDGARARWFGLGPVSVRPDRQGAGIGSALILRGLDALRAMNADGCVVLGDPGYYARFGFESDPALRYGDVPAGYFQRIVFSGPPPAGEVEYHPGFGAA